MIWETLKVLECFQGVYEIKTLKNKPKTLCPFSSVVIYTNCIKPVARKLQTA